MKKLALLLSLSLVFSLQAKVKVNDVELSRTTFAINLKIFC